MGTRRKWLVVLVMLPLLAQAQLLPPVLPPVELPLPERLPPLRDVEATLPAVPRLSVRDQVRALLRGHPDRVERDPRGAPVVRAVIIALSPDPAALQRALTRGFVIQDDSNLPELDARVVTLLVPAGVATAAALRELREADPQGSYDFDHLYVESGAPGSIAGTTRATDARQAVNIRVGLIDGGVDAAHPVFRHRPPQVSGCGGHPVPGAHGTAVASLFVGWADDFAGAAPGAELLAIDVYCGGTAPGGRMRDIVAGLAELSAAGVRVINISIVGPDNAVLAAVIRAVLARSIAIVAAAGNDGPNAGPFYPAAYPGVIAVAAVDGRARVLPESVGGRHISFVAPGADMLAAQPGGAYAPVRGTSFAAPLVAGLLARSLAGQPVESLEAAVSQMVAAAQDKGTKGRDRRYGHGLVGADLRVDPQAHLGRRAAR